MAQNIFTYDPAPHRAGHSLASMTMAERYGDDDPRVMAERRLPEGWWLLPAMIAGALCWFALIRLFIALFF